MSSAIDLGIKISIFIALLLSIYIFITTVLIKDNTHRHLFTTWQLPMLFAIFLDLFHPAK